LAVKFTDKAQQAGQTWLTVEGNTARGFSDCLSILLVCLTW